MIVTESQSCRAVLELARWSLKKNQGTGSLILVDRSGGRCLLAMGVRPQVIENTLVCEWPFNPDELDEFSAPATVVWLLPQPTTSALLRIPAEASLIECPQELAECENLFQSQGGRPLLKTSLGAEPYYRWPDGRELRAQIGESESGVLVKVAAS